MCNSGLLWKCESQNPLTALERHGAFLESIRQHAGWEVDEDAAAVIFLELVANVIKHSPGPIRASLNCNADQLALHVEDDGNLFALEPRLPPSALDEGGRGLFIAAQYASALRVEGRSGGGKITIAILPEKLSG